ncbi:MAG: TetR/AcrR family transcriptional regulator [Lactobacillus sp.]|jgi:AcrR family transcriptional regulator
MVKTTFTKLPQEKQERIFNQLLLEFSRYPLAQAKVAHIVAGAGIARGSFYKYFDDLTDACRYTLGQVLAQIHVHVLEKGLTPQDAYQLVAAFVEKAENLKWQDFIHMHFTYNEGAIPTPQIDLNLPAEQWLIMLACQDVLRQVAKAPQKRE